QGYAFGFFLLIYLGVALGLRRYRLFAIGEWSFRVLFYGGAVFAMLLLDAGLVYLLQLGHDSSLGLSLILVAFLYLPLRDYLWRRTVARKRMPETELFRSVVEVAFSASPAERAGRWQSLLARLFDPLDIQPVRDPVGTVRLLNDGTEMRLPPTADGPALMLRHPFGGRSLFSPVHLGLARQITHLLAEAEVGRHAYERGVAEERQRISRDLHDDVGARLLSGLHRNDIGETRKILREAIADIRTIAGALAGDRLPLSSVLADLRHETAQRVEAAGLVLDWPLALDDQAPEVMVDYALYRHLVSAVREVVSNALRHASASRITVAIDWDNRRLRANITDDGTGLSRKSSGNGLRNITERMTEIGGWIDFPPVAAGTRVTLAMPLRAGGGTP
ncbi:MAG: sensor histidine kinase, partial [Zavarzinia sp.]|nr:sensor histidine kinase [Zavarzinia sp.]